MKNQQILVRLFRDGRPVAAPRPADNQSVWEQAHDCNRALRKVHKSDPTLAKGVAFVVTARPFPYGNATNRIIVC